MSRVLLLRHGATAGNLARRYIGSTDEPLAPAGIAQLRGLRFPAPDHLFVSPMRRTRQSAALLFPRTPQTLVEAFRETPFGPFEGKTADELAHDPAYRAWVDSLCRDPIPGQEAPAVQKARCLAAFRDAMAAVGRQQTAVFVVHGGTIMTILEALAQPPGEFYDFHLPPGGFLSGTYREGWLYLDPS